MSFLLILGIIGIYILSIIIIHLYYKNDWIKHLEEASRGHRYSDRFYVKYKGGSIDTSFNAFYYWMELSDDVFIHPIIIFIPVLNTIAIFLLIVIFVCEKIDSLFKKIGSIKFIKLK